MPASSLGARRDKHASLLLLVWLATCVVAARGQVPTCTADETMSIGNDGVECTPVNCFNKYGAAKPVFNTTSHLCGPAPPSPSPTPSAPTPLPSVGNGTCVHGTVVCGSGCACRCDAGWRTDTSGTSSNPFEAVYCNASTDSLDSEIPGEGGKAVCSSDVECFFVDRLPFALVRGGAREQPMSQGRCLAPCQRASEPPAPERVSMLLHRIFPRTPAPRPASCR
ncbi:hypothetical protein EON67_09620 [archaeon]|nr:MAG: hypothetical protein EON67_09620 [archaeon]